MPKGKGTYGSKVGRPPKKQKKYYGGGKVGISTDPFSTKNPKGVPAQQVREAMADEIMYPMLDVEVENAKQNISEDMPSDIPSTNAMERSQTSPDVTNYNEGGKVGADILDITRNISKKEEYSKKRKGASDLTYKPQREYYTKASKKAIDKFDWGIKGKKK